MSVVVWVSHHPQCLPEGGGSNRYSGQDEKGLLQYFLLWRPSGYLQSGKIHFSVDNLSTTDDKCMILHPVRRLPEGRQERPLKASFPMCRRRRVLCFQMDSVDLMERVVHRTLYICMQSPQMSFCNCKSSECLTLLYGISCFNKSV